MEHRYLQSREERQQADRNEPIKKFDAQKQDTTPSKWEETAMDAIEMANDYNTDYTWDTGHEVEALGKLTKAKDQAVLQGRLDELMNPWGGEDTFLQGMKARLTNEYEEHRYKKLKEAQRDTTR